MKKNLKISFVILMLIAILLPITYSFAIENTNKTEKEKSFFEITQLEVSRNEKIEMTIYFEKIKYDKFEFSLKSSSNMEKIEVSNEGSNAHVEKNSNEITIEVDKSNNNINQMILYYPVPETSQINDVIRFVATVTNKEVIEEPTDSEEIIAETDTESEINTEVTTPVEAESQTIEVQVKIVEKNEELEKDESEENKKDDNQMKDDKKMQEKQFEEKEMNDTMKQTMSTNNQKGETTTVTYNGSDNNYLSSLSIIGYELNKIFSKDKSTYFITVGNDVTSLNIDAIVENSLSKISIYGNEDLKEGTNKILISVTAENGNVRNYRIYVTKNV